MYTVSLIFSHIYSLVFAIVMTNKCKLLALKYKLKYGEERFNDNCKSLDECILLISSFIYTPDYVSNVLAVYNLVVISLNCVELSESNVYLNFLSSFAFTFCLGEFVSCSFSVSKVYSVLSVCIVFVLTVNIFVSIERCCVILNNICPCLCFTDECGEL